MHSAKPIILWQPMGAQPLGAVPAHADHAWLSREQETALLRAAVQACPVNVTISDLRRPGHPLCYVNAAFCATTGYAAEEILGRNCRFLQGPESDPAVIAAMRDAIAARRPISVELVNYRRDGTPFRNRLELAPVTDQARGIDAYIGIQRDITAFRAAETTRREREKLEALGRLAGGFAHELNNMLQPIITYAELLGARLPPGEPGTAEELAVMLDCARAAGDIARQVLHFSRRSAADGRPVPAGERIAQAVRFAVRLLPPGVTVTVRGVEALAGTCTIEPTEMVQVLGNLFKNAADAMAGRGAITVLAQERAGTLVLTVEDDGPGMDPATAGRVFEPFFTTKPMGQGTGLGLSAVWGLVRGWGGQISLDTAPGCGARFVIELPLAAPAPACTPS
jgi:PAS domain S-box-containing protein